MSLFPAGQPSPAPVHGRARRHGAAGRYGPAPRACHDGGPDAVTPASPRGRSWHRCPVTVYLSGLPLIGDGDNHLGDLPDARDLPDDIQTFDPTGSASHGSDPPLLDQSQRASLKDTSSLRCPGPYNPAAALPPKVVKRVLALEFVEMSELRADIWPDEPPATDGGHPTARRPAKPPITNIRTWLECYGRMAAILCSRFPNKAPELWAYQTSILHAAHAYEGANWVAYDRLYRREMLAKKDLNWAVPNTRLYSEAFTGRAKRHPQCQHCLAEDHATANCPLNPNPPVVGWFQGAQIGAFQAPQWPMVPTPIAAKTATKQEVCRNYNSNRCRFPKCRYLHQCADCAGDHPAPLCPLRSTPSTSRGPSRAALQSRGARTQPYPSTGAQGLE